MVTDTTADMLAQIRNAGKARKESLILPYSKMRFAVASVLLKNGYLSSVLKKGKRISKTMELGLVYDAGGNPRVTGAKKISKPSCRVYFGAKDIKPVRHGYGHLFLSTPKGILTGNEARKMKIGGEALFKIW